jgi:hypothetical protein
MRCNSELLTAMLFATALFAGVVAGAALRSGTTSNTDSPYTMARGNSQSP